MRRGALLLTVLIIFLGAGLAWVRVSSAPPDDPDPAAGASDPSLRELSAENAEAAPPTTPPEPATPALKGEPSTPTELGASPALKEVARQLRAGVDEDVVLTFIQNSPTPFQLGSEEIIYLTDLGAPGRIINAMIERDEALRSSALEEPGEAWPPARTVAQVAATNREPETGDVPAAPESETVAVETPTSVIGVDYFHGYLAPYGTWVDVPGYGLCWQPSVCLTTPGWMPYGDCGRWLYTDYGWYWYSDYSWGWAVFHYGRWLHHSRWGWCWVPGTVWGPSWVSWRYADPYCGWAPLPPYTRSGFYFSVGISWGIPSWCYIYVPASRVCYKSPRTCAVPYAEARRIHRRAIAQDNYSVSRNHTIENRGIPPETLARDSGAEIHRVRIHERRDSPSSRLRRERVENDGDTLTVFHPDRVSRTRRDQTEVQTVPEERPLSRLSPQRPMSKRRYNGQRNSDTAPGRRESIVTPTEGSLSQRGSIDEAIPTRETRGGTQRPTARVDSGRRIRSQEPSPEPTAAVPSGGRNSDHNADSRKPDNSLVIIGRRNFQQRPASARPSKNAALHTTAPAPLIGTASPSGVREVNRQVPSVPVVRPQTETPLPSTRSLIVTPTERARSTPRVAPVTMTTPRVDRTVPNLTPRPVTPALTRGSAISQRAPLQRRVVTRPASPVAVSPPAQRVAPASAPARVFTPSTLQTRSTPSSRTVAPTRPAPQSRATYTAPAAPAQPSAPAARRAEPARGSGARRANRN